VAFAEGFQGLGAAPVNNCGCPILDVSRHPVSYMESASKTKYQKLIGMMDAFVSGQSRSRDFVSQMEGEFATSDLDNDDRFSDLQLALAMFGAVDREEDEKMLAGECKYALRLLREEL